MPHDPELVAETRAWLLKAVQDLGAGSHDLCAAPPLPRMLLFMPNRRLRKP
jgi:hypothetical protein